MRTGGFSIPFSQLAVIFKVFQSLERKDHPTLSKESKIKLGERPAAFDGEISTHGQFIAERFAAGCPTTTEDALEFISNVLG
jgi:hypothetical protein